MLDNGVCLVNITNYTEFKEIPLLKFLFSKLDFEEAKELIVLRYNAVKNEVLTLEK